MSRCDAMAWAAPAGCDGCGKPLVGRQKRWCADGCDDLYWSNHRYTFARAVKLDAAKRSGRYRSGYRCERCGGTTRAPEVNHRTAALGAHSQESCLHHQENLEVLCRDCHLEETRAQRRAGLFGHQARTAPLGEQLRLVAAGFVEAQDPQ